MPVAIEPSWGDALASEFTQPYFRELTAFVRQEYAAGPCYPPGRLIFNAFRQTPFERVRVVILGQDPYHEAGQAMGLSFSVPEGVEAPPSLRNIFQEIAEEYPSRQGASTDLTRWATQGVLLLNTCLTVRAHQAFSHSGRGWETFTDAAIRALSARREGLVFMLWGAPAGRKAALIDAARHLVLRSPHPSPLSAYRGFFHNGHFTLCNQYLQQHGQPPIVW